ncbi:MAG: macro domain-containing protein [Lachnospiraceae bacterium]|nr:macro domain-containing protein [Lachnospiraceae bacterium]
MSSIEIKKIGITKLDTDAVVNAANTGLWEGGGVCGFIFRDAGSKEMTEACQKIGHCDEGSAVITPGFNLPAKYVIHAVGPRWYGGDHNEPKLLYSAYNQSLLLARENGLHSIGFPLISAGIFGYPVDKAWRQAIRACNDFIQNNPDYDIKIVFAVLDDRILAAGEETLKGIVGDEDYDT